MAMVELKAWFSVDLAEFINPSLGTCGLRTSNITEVITICGLKSRRSAGLSISPETQTLLVLIQYPQYLGNLRIEPLSVVWMPVREHKPLASISLSFDAGELWFHTESCIPYTGSQVGGYNLTRHPWQNFSFWKVTTKGTCSFKGFFHGSQQPKRLTSSCSLLISQNLVTLEISST